MARAHAQVYSTPDSPVQYNAFDLDLQLWVGACLYKGAVGIYRIFVGELNDEDADRHYREGMALATTLQASYATPGVATLRTNQKQVSTGTAVINALRAFGPSSLTFIVTTGQRLVSSRGTTSGSTQYAVTVTGSGTSWQVDDIELASAGNS